MSKRFERKLQKIQENVHLKKTSEMRTKLMQLQAEHDGLKAQHKSLQMEHKANQRELKVHQTAKEKQLKNLEMGRKTRSAAAKKKS